MYPADNTDSDYNTTNRGIIKDANLSISNSQLPQSSTSSSLSLSLSLPSSSSSSLSLPSSSSSSLQSATAASATGKVDEIGITLKSGNDGGIETGKMVNVEELKGTGIREVTF
ncbi:hypothetical protein WUBG_05205 [Wuchereria bancrofti]|uniref:Uncharacterized protein n=1 Tax=Wuchereria bancrofti TaxID=6293 RepID=J9F335_WUCBA|nr:hypothetical protein WUBG_05205 [Wuchereria bancrofti]